MLLLDVLGSVDLAAQFSRGKTPLWVFLKYLSELALNSSRAFAHLIGLFGF